MLFRARARTIVVAALALCVAGPMTCLAAADGRQVSTSAELAAAITSARAGDRICLAAGTYEVRGSKLAAAPVTIESEKTQDHAVIRAIDGDGDYILMIPEFPDADGAVVIRGIIFEGSAKDVGGIQALSTRLEIEDCEFNNFAGAKKATVDSRYGKDKGSHKGLRVSRCVFQRNPRSCAVSCLGSAIVEDCVLENIHGGMSFDDWSGKWGHKNRRNYKVVVRRNHVYRTEGTDWKCHAITTRTTAPEVCDNLIHDLSKGDCSAMTIAANGFDMQGTPTGAVVCRNVIIDKWKAEDSGYIHEAIEYGEYMPTKGKIYENVIVARVRIAPALYNKGHENLWFNNTLYGNNRLFHCYGVSCRYFNHIQVGGVAEGSYYPTDEAKISAGERKRLASVEKKGDIYTYTYVKRAAERGKVTRIQIPVLESSCFQGVAHSSDRGFARGSSYFEADPKFIDPDNLDFHLRYDSPCINKGQGSRDGLTPSDVGAYEYPIQVCGFTVDRQGRCAWQWSNGSQKVAKTVRVRWNAKAFPTSAQGKGDETVGEVDAKETDSTKTGKRQGYFAAFVMDIKGRWSEPTPDGVHGAMIGGDARPALPWRFFRTTAVPPKQNE